MSIQDRFLGAEWFTPVQNLPVIVIGLGGVGSWLSLFLSRAGCSIYAFEFDKVEEHNLGGQLYGGDHIGMSKLKAMDNLIKQLSQGRFVPEGKYEKASLKHHIVFSCADCMDARKIAFNNWLSAIKLQEESTTDIIPIFLDARMLMEYSQVYTVTPDKIKEYKKSLFNNEDVPDISCNTKATSHIGAYTASLMVQTFLNHVTNCINKMDIREVPFLTVTESPLILTELRNEIIKD